MAIIEDMAWQHRSFKNERYISKYCPKTKWESESSCIKATINGTEMYVSVHPNNTEYQAILEWVADGNTITAAD